MLKKAAKGFCCFLKGLRGCGSNAHVSLWAEIKNPGRVFLGSDASIQAHARLLVNGDNSFIKIGRGTTIFPYALLKANNGKIEIGQFSSVNDYTVIDGCGGVVIGDDVHIATHVVMVASEHDYRKLGSLEFSLNMEGRGIRIENSVWIGAHAVILDGVRIGTGSVIGAGAVVTKDIPAHALAVGVPARVIKTLLP